MVANFTNSSVAEERVKPLLAEGEDFVALIGTRKRLVALTDARLILLGYGGGYSSIRNSSISAIEVSDGQGPEKYLKLYFGGGLSRTISAPDATQAAILVSATAR